MVKECASSSEALSAFITACSTTTAASVNASEQQLHGTAHRSDLVPFSTTRGTSSMWYMWHVCKYGFYARYPNIHQAQGVARTIEAHFTACMRARVTSPPAFAFRLTHDRRLLSLE